MFIGKKQISLKISSSKKKEKIEEQHQNVTQKQLSNCVHSSKIDMITYTKWLQRKMLQLCFAFSFICCEIIKPLVGAQIELLTQKRVFFCKKEQKLTIFIQ